MSRVESVQRKAADLPTEGIDTSFNTTIAGYIRKYNEGNRWDAETDELLPTLLHADKLKLTMIDVAVRDQLAKSDDDAVTAHRMQLRDHLFRHQQELKQYEAREDQKKRWKLKEAGLSEQSKEVFEIIGNDQLRTLSEDGLERMIALIETLETSNTVSEKLKQDLKTRLTAVQKGNETKESMEQRKLETEAAIEKLQVEAFKGQFGVAPHDTQWETERLKIEHWFKALKDKEKELTSFHVAFSANRMTARNINIGDTARGGSFKVQELGKPPSTTDRTMSLDNTVSGIGGRLNPEHFHAQDTGKDLTNEKGLHDLSASLLSGTLPIYGQLKYYKDSIVLFVPLPLETDLQILAALAKVPGADEAAIRKMGSKVTRPIFAQASDMGTRYVDRKPASEGGEGQFGYGLTGTVIRKRGDVARKINEADLAARRHGALAYTEVVRATITTVNEIVMAYRQHASATFPMYARWSQTRGAFEVCDAKGEPTGGLIGNDGHAK